MKLRWIHVLLPVAILFGSVTFASCMVGDETPPAKVAEPGQAGSSLSGDGAEDGHADHDDHGHADEDDHAGHADEDDHAGHADEDDHAGHVDDAEHADDGDSGQDDHSDHGDEVVQLSAAEIAEFGIRVETAGPGILENSLELPGEVRPNDDRLAHIVPRYSGIAMEVRASIGDYVRRGQVLAIIESDESLAPFEVKTLISGTVIGKHITLGEAASRDRDAFVIADLSNVWVDLTVYQGDLDRVQVGQNVDVYIGHELAYEDGKISYVTPIVDSHTRTATARLVVPNPNKAWRPGMFVTGQVLVERIEVPLVVPGSAFYRMEGETVVFLETPEGFRPRSVELGRRGEGRIEVVSGLSAGDRYVSEGGFTLKAELEKGGFGHAGHAH